VIFREPDVLWIVSDRRVSLIVVVFHERTDGCSVAENDGDALAALVVNKLRGTAETTGKVRYTRWRRTGNG